MAGKQEGPAARRYRPRVLVPEGYHPAFADCLEVFEEAGWHCESCGEPFFSIGISRRTGLPFIRYPHRAHDYNSSPGDPKPIIHAFCCACHLAYDNRRPGRRRRKEK